jgi:ribonucleotide reductase alpha subunit
MIRDLISEGIWTEELKNKVIYLGGSIKDLTEIPKHIRDLYPTAFDTSQKVMIDQSAERSPFVDQSQSLNIHLSAPTYASVSSMHIYGWKKGLKTGQYYLRSQPAKRAAQVTIDPTLAADMERQISSGTKDVKGEPEQNPVDESSLEGWVCNRDEGCMACGS